MFIPKKGMRGEPVKRLQERPGIGSDSIVGAATEKSEKAFQAVHGLYPCRPLSKSRGTEAAILRANYSKGSTMKRLHLILAAVGSLALSACVIEAPGGSGSAAGGGISQAAGEQACRSALMRYHNTGNVRIVSSEPYQGGGLFVRGAVGSSGELWQCIAFADGSTGELQYLGSGGTATQLPSSPPGRPAVGSEYDLTEFQGARAGQAEMGIRSLGYEPVRSRGLTTWWFNRQTGACAEIVTSQGRYSSVTMLPAQDC